MTDEQIKHMVERFLAWKLPANFNPDAGISFEPEFNVEWNAKHGNPPQRHEPVGTNLFGYTEAEAMVRHMLEGLPAMTKATGSSELVERLREGVQALYHEPGQSTPIYAIVPANQTMRKAADRITDLEARLARAEASAPRPDNALADELAKHWLADVGCLHDDSPTGGSNKPSCSCGWTGERVATVGDAARLWARHALAALRQPVDAIDAELVERLDRLIDVRRDFVAKREAMNAAIPDVVNGTPAERALYDERYKADHEAEHALYREALGFAAWAAEANPLSRTPSPEKAEIERLRNIAQRVAEMETVEELLTGPGIAGLTVAGKLNTMQERRIARDTLIQDARAALTPSPAVDLLREARCPLCQTAAPEAFVSQCNRPECPYRSNTK